MFFEKGKRRLTDLGIPDILREPRVRNGYPTEKPVPILEILIQQSSAGDELVVDPFMGSASTGVAAIKHGRRFIGADTSALSIELARERLGPSAGPRQLLQPLRLL